MALSDSLFRRRREFLRDREQDEPSQTRLDTRLLLLHNIVSETSELDGVGLGTVICTYCRNRVPLHLLTPE